MSSRLARLFLLTLTLANSALAGSPGTVEVVADELSPATRDTLREIVASELAQRGLGLAGAQASGAGKADFVLKIGPLGHRMVLTLSELVPSSTETLLASSPGLAITQS